MNELLIKRYEKQILKHGISKQMAREIAEVAIETSNGNNIETYINYAIDLVYGLGFSQKAVNK